MARNTLTRDLNFLHDAHRQGDRETARAGYLKILRSHPNEIQALHGLGIIYAQEDKFSEAVDYFKACVKQKPNDPAIYLHLANALKNQGLFTKAIDVLNTTLEFFPDYPPALNNLGTIYYALAKLPSAVAFYQLAIKVKSDYIDAYYNLGMALAKQQRFSDAMYAYETLLTYAPKHIAARFHLAITLMYLEKIPQALVHLVEIEKVQPNHFETQTNLATCYLRQGNFNKAKEHYLKALELSPHDSQILFNLGFINMQQGQTDQAIQFYQKAVQINQDDFAAHNNLGVAFLAKQHLNFALKHFSEALRIQPTNAALGYTVKMLSQQEQVSAAPPDYIKALFDGYADHYEPHLLMALDYQVPSILETALLSVKKPANADILDLGCGTGLCGVTFKKYAKTLMGSDISENMLAIAANKNIYNELRAEDMNTTLDRDSERFDVIVAGDVFVYTGDLTMVFSAAYNALKKEGVLLFNAEIDEKESFQMNQSGRFSHSKQYLDELALKSGFKIMYYRIANTRTQNNATVVGHIYALSK